eukprot:m.246854 g.246854  ORF g.246854 m.246854 type:complete len:357 (-) comp15207_c0_seq1:117-1187(-)
MNITVSDIDKKSFMNEMSSVAETFYGSSSDIDQSVPLVSDIGSDDGDWSTTQSDCPAPSSLVLLGGTTQVLPQTTASTPPPSPATQTSSPPGSPQPRAQETTEPSSTDSSADKPPYSFPCLIGLALKNSDAGCLCVRDIYAYIVKNFPYYLTAKSGWKNSVRHNLSLNKYFTKVQRKETSAKSSLWTIAPMMHDQLDRDIRQCVNRFPNRVRRDSASASPLRRAASQPVVSVNLPARIVPHSASLSAIKVPKTSVAPTVAASSPAARRLNFYDSAPPRTIFEGTSLPSASQVASSVNLLSRLAVTPAEDLWGPEVLSCIDGLGEPSYLQSIDELLLSSTDSDVTMLSDLIDGSWQP